MTKITCGGLTLERLGRRWHVWAMGLKLSFFARLLLIAVFALLTGPRPVMADGDRVVICGADGGARVVVFDFETGAPVEPVGFHACDHCNATAAFLPPTAPHIAERAAMAFVPPAPLVAPVVSRMPLAAPSVRAPPFSV